MLQEGNIRVGLEGKHIRREAAGTVRSLNGRSDRLEYLDPTDTCNRGDTEAQLRQLTRTGQFLQLLSGTAEVMDPIQ